ncbi:DNA replication and repair protein RecF, partial [Haemophilus influenzae]
WYH